MGGATCSAILNIAGEHFQCDMQHSDGWGHSNREAAAIWTGITPEPASEPTA